MDHETKPTHVNAHTKRIGRNHDVESILFIALKALQYLCFYLRCQFCMIGSNTKVKNALAQFLSNEFSCLFICAIHNASLSLSW